MPNGKADAAQDVQTDELPAEDVVPTSVDENEQAIGDTADSLEFDELLGRTDPNNKRGGLSRKEARELKEDAETEPEDVETDLFKEVQELRSLINQDRDVRLQTKAESQFTNALEDAGVDVSTFNSQFKSDYLGRFDELMQEGMSTGKASKFALDMVLPKIQAQESENRSNGRMRVKLPPTGMTQAKTTYKLSDVQKIMKTDKNEYNRIMNGRDNGSITVV